MVAGTTQGSSRANVGDKAFGCWFDVDRSAVSDAEAFTDVLRDSDLALGSYGGWERERIASSIGRPSLKSCRRDPPMIESSPAA